MRIFHVIIKPLWILVIITMTLLCGNAVWLIWDQWRLKALQSKEEEELTDLLVESALVTDENPHQIRVALFDAGLDDGTATKDLKRILGAEPTIVWKSISSSELQSEALKDSDIVIFPGGRSSIQGEALGDYGKEIVRKFVRTGGGYVGICGGAFLATTNYDWGMDLVNAEPMARTIDVPGNETASMAARGVGMVKMELTHAGRMVLGDVSGWLDIRYTGGPIVSPAERNDLPGYVCLGVFRTELWQFEPQRGTMINTPAIIAGRFGKGRVILFSPHPEMTEGLEFLVRQAILATARSPSVHGDP